MINFLEKSREKIKEKVKKEIEILSREKEKKEGSKEIEIWDVPFYQNIALKNFDKNSVKNFFIF